MTTRVEEFAAALVENDSSKLSALGINTRQECIARPALFLEALMRRSPRLRLEDEVFLPLTLMLRMILAEAHRNQEHSLIRSVYSLSKRLGRMRVGVLETVCAGLHDSPAFSDVEFWVESSKSLIFDDIDRWTSLTKGVFYPEIGNLTSLTSVEINILIALLRTQGMLSTMKSLNLHSHIRSNYLTRMEAIYRFQVAGINVELSPCDEFKMWLLQVGSRLSNRDYVNPKLIAMLQRFSVDTANLGDEFGYSALLELLLTLPERCRLKYRRSERIADSSRDFKNGVSYLCFCGETSNSWLPVRFDGPYRIVCEKSALPTIICERCFLIIFPIEYNADAEDCHRRYCEEPSVTPVPPSSLEAVFAANSPSTALSKFNLDLIDRDKLNIHDRPGTGPEHFKTRRTSRDSFESLPPLNAQIKR